MFIRKLFIILCFSLAIPLLTVAQEIKEEIETSIDRSEMPENAIELLDEFWPNRSDIDYYRETDGKTVTYEAKLEFRRYKYSIEFDQEGSVLDVEQLIEFDEIPEEARSEITDDLEDQFSKYDITRIQRQFVTTETDEDDEDFIDDILEYDSEDYKIRYEIVVDGQSRRELGSFEMLYDRSGELIEKRRILRRSLDNIW
jgi:hypothetical protein